MESLFPLTIDAEPVTAGPTAFQLNRLSLLSSSLPLCDLPFLLCLAFRLVTLTWGVGGGLSHVPCNWKQIHLLKPYSCTGREREFRYALLLQLFGVLAFESGPPLPRSIWDRDRQGWTRFPFDWWRGWIRAAGPVWVWRGRGREG